MKNSLAIWHYPHRTMEENIRFFATQGFPAVSVHGARLADALARGEGDRLAQAIHESGVTLTVHYALPRAHTPERVRAFEQGIDSIGAWHKSYGLIHVLSFDVPAAIRDHMTPYLEYAMAQTEGCLLAVEDFGLTADERAQIAYLKGNPRFGYLLDIGHMFLRIRGKNQSGKALFSHHDDECPQCDNPGYTDFMRAMDTKEFPVFEMHLHNNDGVNDTHQFLEDGPLDIAMIARVVRDRGFDGIMTIESAPGFKFDCYGDDADTRIMQTFEYWKACYDASEN